MLLEASLNRFTILLLVANRQIGCLTNRIRNIAVFIAYSYRQTKELKKVRFHETMAVREILQNGIKEENPSEERLFCKAMRAVNGDEKSRVADFNAQYALSRTILTTVLISTILIIVLYPCFWQSYLTIAILLICWNRYKERAYYYAREVLNEYLKKNKQ